MVVSQSSYARWPKKGTLGSLGVLKKPKKTKLRKKSKEVRSSAPNSLILKRKARPRKVKR